MIELRELVAAPGLAPLTAVVRTGEVVQLDGPAAAARALLEVLAGRRAPVAGEVRWRDGRSRRVLVRAGEVLPPGVEADDALALWRALAGRERPAAAVGGGAGDRRPGGDAAGAAARRGLGGGPVLWLVDGVVEAGAEPVVARADQDVRGGSGALVWTTAAARGHADRVLAVVEAAGGAAVTPATGAAARVEPRAMARPERARAALALARFALAAMSSRATLALAAVGAAWLALAAAVIAVHEEFWFAPGSRRGFELLALLAGLGTAGLVASSAAARAAVARAWPPMLRETGATPAARALALVAGDGGGALPAAVVAAWPACWSAAALDQGEPLKAALATVLAVVVGAIVAGAVTRALRVAPVGALVGAAVAAGVMW